MSDHWQQVSLAEICSVSAGNSAPQDPAYFAAGTIPFFRTSDAGRVKFGTIYESQDKLNAQGASKLRRYPAGTILFPKSGASTFLNHRVVLGVEGCVSSHLATIVPDLSQVLPQFLLYALTLIDAKDLIQDQSYPSLNLPAIEKIGIHLPPIAEQQRIVRLLDEAFMGIAIAKANTEKNLQNARALFESHLNFIFTQAGEGWENRPLKDLCSLLADGDWIESKDQSPSGIRLIQTGNVGKGEFKDRSGKARFISDTTFKKLRCTEIVEGDCLVSRLPDPVGRSCIIPKNTEKMITAVDCTILRFKPQVLLPKYFVYYSQSSTYLRDIAKLCTGTTRNRISRSNLGATAIPVPPLSDQERILSTLEKLESRTVALEESYENRLTALEDLAKSLLSEAFAGNLRAA